MNTFDDGPNYDAADQLPDEREIAEWALAQCARAGAPTDAIETLATMLHVSAPDLWEMRR